MKVTYEFNFFILTKIKREIQQKSAYLHPDQANQPQEILN